MLFCILAPARVYIAPERFSFMGVFMSKIKKFFRFVGSLFVSFGSYVYDSYTSSKVHKFFVRRKYRRFISSIGECSVFFGLPGSGKTSFCALLTHWCEVLGVPVYSNVPLLGAIPFDKSEFGRFDMSDALIILDECSLFYDGRNFQTNFNDASLSYLKLLRHRHNHLVCLSQHLDIDIKFIRLSNNVFQLKKTFLFRSFTSVVKVRRYVDVNEDTHKFEDFYDKPHGLFKLFSTFRFFRPFYYRYFDSYDAPVLPPLPDRDVYRNKKGLDHFLKTFKTTLGKV